MKSRPLTIVLRLALVLSIPFAVHLMARLVLFNLPGYDTGGWSEVISDCNYSIIGQACAEQTVYWWQTFEPEDGLDVFFSHFAGGVLLIAGVFLCVVFYWMFQWALGIEDDSEDPCNDPGCPCARHVVERQEQQAAQTAMIAATTAAVVSTTINSGS